MIYIQNNQADKLSLLLEFLYPYLVIDPAEFYNNYFDIDTANDDGLANWGEILCVGNVVYTGNYTKVWGFAQPADPLYPTYPQNFSNGNFFAGNSELSVLTTDAYRALLKLTYSFNTSNFTIPSIVNIINIYFINKGNPSQYVTVTETYPMHLNFIFSQPLTPIDSTLFNLPNTIPIPMGVSTSGL